MLTRIMLLKFMHKFYKPMYKLAFNHFYTRVENIEIAQLIEYWLIIRRHVASMVVCNQIKRQTSSTEMEDVVSKIIECQLLCEKRHKHHLFRI